jgi:hypothetical protein
MKVERDAFDREIGFAQFEKTLLEDYAEDFLAKEFLRCLIAQAGRQSVSRFDLKEFFATRWGGEFEEVEGALDGVDGEEAGLVFAGERVVDAVEVEGDEDFGDAMEWAEAEVAQDRGGAGG